MSNTAQSERDSFLRNALPTAESVWVGSSLAFHVLNAVTERPDDPAFRDQLADSLIGQRASMWGGPQDERLGLIIDRASILDDSVIIGYVGDETPYTFRPVGGNEAPGDTVLHQIIVPRATES